MALPSGDMSILATLLAATLEKQGQMLQAITDTNRNVERLATRIDGIETRIDSIETFLRGAQSAAPVPRAAPPAAVLPAYAPAGAVLGGLEQAGVPVAGPSRLPGSADAQNASAGSHKEVVASPSPTILTAAPPIEAAKPLPVSVSLKNTHTPLPEATSETPEAVVAGPSKKGKERERIPPDEHPIPANPQDVQPSLTASTMSTDKPPLPNALHNNSAQPTPSEPKTLPIPSSGRAAPKRAIDSDSDDDIPVPRKRVRKLNLPRGPVVPLPWTHGKERSTPQTTLALASTSTIPRSVPPPTLPSPASPVSPLPCPSIPAIETDTRPNDPPASSSSTKPCVEQPRRQRVEVFISWDAETHSRARDSVPLSDLDVPQDATQNRAEARAEAGALFKDAFGSGDLSDLTDLDSDDGADDSGDMLVGGDVVVPEAEPPAASEPVANGGAVLGDDGPEHKRPRRTCANDVNYAERFAFRDFEDDVGFVPLQTRDSDAEYAPSRKPHHDPLPGPSSTRMLAHRLKMAPKHSPTTASVSTSGPSGPSLAKKPSTKPKSSEQVVRPPRDAQPPEDEPLQKPGPSSPQKLTIKISPQRHQAAPNEPLAGPSGSSSVPQARSKAKAEPRPSPPLRLRDEVKKDKVELELIPPEGIRRRLDGLNAREVKLEPRERDVVVTRRFMSETYGGNTQALFPAISSTKRAALGGHQHHIIYPTLKRNPEAPLMPGQPGLLCRALSTVPWEDADITKLKLMVGLGEGLWAYMGDYTTEPAVPLSEEEWNSLPEKTKRTWANDVATANKHIPLHSRILLRDRWGREPTEDEVSEEAAVIKAQANLQPKKHRPKPTEDELQQVMRAYSSGKQIIYIWRFKCVGYDEAFQRELVLKYSAWQRKSAPVGQPAAAPRPALGDRDGGAAARPTSSGENTSAPAQGSSTITRIGPPRGTKQLLRNARPAPLRAPPAGAAASIPSPPITPSPIREVDPTREQEKRPGSLLEELRDSFSKKRLYTIPDPELARLLFERRHGMQEMRSAGKIEPNEYLLLGEFCRRHGFLWEV
ncbi:hypothetical protein PsYK624_139630 [Phanerochaete sordida]|uniref:DUF6697 domain-containing protein n=1 Tax=Phanerochaete sordida TaxID=48140 RepID=A0A9P3GLV2_9APHY|nr:hypothetical protein PsYK624_139630 [Phanerochaete sordida]